MLLGKKQIKSLEEKLTGAEDDVDRCRAELDEAIEVSMENAEALANSAGEGTLEIAELRCSQTVPEVWQEALVAEAGSSRAR